MRTATSWRKIALASVALVGLVLAVVVASSGSAGKDQRSSAGGDRALPPSERPSFVASGSSNVYAVDIASRSLEQLTSNDEEQMVSEPVWSPKGGIVLSEASSPEDPSKLVLLEPDGSRKSPIRTRLRNVYQPSWSPDGRRIAVASLGEGIYVLDTRTGGTQHLKQTGAGYDSPVWSPDGKAIVFQRQVSSTNWDLYRVDPTGRRLRRLTRDPLQQL